MYLRLESATAALTSSSRCANERKCGWLRASEQEGPRYAFGSDAAEEGWVGARAQPLEDPLSLGAASIGVWIERVGHTLAKEPLRLLLDVRGASRLVAPEHARRVHTALSGASCGWEGTAVASRSG